ncbi:MAG TPA: DMT family transporter [Candidatus Sulfotelmatobacter sp.]|nr:DMT family transporter [Candidatus Sulfotelmatobacter sp.]
MHSPPDSQPMTLGYFYAGLIIVIWTGFTLITRIGVTGSLTPYDVIAIRLATAAILAVPMWLHLSHHRRIDWHMAALTATGGLGYVILVYCAFHLAPASHGGILLSGLQPFVMSLCTWAVMGEKPTRQRLAGMAAIGMGAAVLGYGVLTGGSDSWRGDLLFVGASLSWALYAVLARRWKVSPWETTLNVSLLAAAVYLPVYLLALPKTIMQSNWSEIMIQAAYQGALAAFIHAFIYMRAVEILGPSRLGVLTAITPVTAAMAAVPLLHEPLTASLLASLVLVTTGVVVGNGISLPRLKPLPSEG